MSLRKSPTRTPAFLQANRRNAKKSTGPRTALGKAWSSLNRMKHGRCSAQYLNLIKALINAPPGEVGLTAEALLASKLVVHPLLKDMAELGLEAEIDNCDMARRMRTG